MANKAQPVPDPLRTVVGGLDPSECQHSLQFPCTYKSRLPATWMLKWADCNCDPEDEHTIPQVSAICSVCLASILRALKRKGGMACSGCGLIYDPGELMIADVVEL